LLALGVTYAYFSSAVIGEGNDQVVTTGTLQLIYTDSAEINLPNIQPGEDISKRFSVENTGTLSTAYTINFTKLINTIENEELIYTLSCISNNGTCEGLEETAIDAYTLSKDVGGKEGYGNNILTKPIDLLTADEAAYAGGVYGISNSSYYLHTNENYWTMSPYYFSEHSRAYMFFVNSPGVVNSNYLNIVSIAVVPALSLKSSVKISSGTGLYNNPYIVK